MKAEPQFFDMSAVDINQLHQAKGWQQKYKLLLRWGKLIQPDCAIRIDDFKLNACEANTWVKCTKLLENSNPILTIRFDSESSVVKGLGVLILYHCHEKSFEAVRDFDLDGLMTDLQLTSHLSPSRVNGFLSLWTAVKNFCENR